ncbi:hypothetical protein LRP52_37105 [Photobacterium sp. ZSDE20]|uniref:Uncharacterized protein n=1 Tax=Photobacterium pectinilyticum TaxID=2906793 RepID=A0ABT1NA74_9GAMM|nr:hypothetical protein [Photobacterium sp. ZSDE20]MCQ1060611.1 hypothetical protein [Photobacterium sp. ZSDE20]MDD1827806.1 hypothetical protein [Photobacterium sp. ZSDE20]
MKLDQKKKIAIVAAVVVLGLGAFFLSSPKPTRIHDPEGLEHVRAMFDDTNAQDMIESLRHVVQTNDEFTIIDEVTADRLTRSGPEGDWFIVVEALDGAELDRISADSVLGHEFTTVNDRLLMRDGSRLVLVEHEEN